MRRTCIIISFFLLVLPEAGTKAQGLISNRSVTGVCYAGNRVNRIYLPPPKNFLTKSDSKGGGKITVSYSGFTAEAKTAFEYAVKILESMLPSDLKMTVKASWTKISTAGVLGNSSITGFAVGWGIDALNPMVYYPVTVAEKIAGKSLNEDYDADVELMLNNTAKWYLGTDGNTPATKYDLVTVILHELCHGLGFFDSMSADNSLGSYGIGTIPIIYDTFIENLTEKRLTDTTYFKRYSLSLYQALVDGQLYFSGPLTRRYLSGSRARLYSPSEWDPGSSVSHLDEIRTQQADGLMTPYIDFGEAIHDPGKLTMSILGDLGWVNTRILPGEIKDTEEHLSEIQINATIQSDTAYNKEMVGLVYSFNDFLNSDTLIMTPMLNDSYSTVIQIPFYNTRLNYYLFVADNFLRLYKSPSRAEKDPYSLYIGVDTVKPVISHTPAEYYFENIDSVLFETVVTDNLGVDSVYIEYKVNSGPTNYSGLTLKELNKYTLNLNVKPLLLNGGDTIKYRIIAIDNASVQNTAISPASDYYKIGIETLLPAVKSYSTDFDDASAEFFNSGFEIVKPSNFNTTALHSEHPYKSPDKDYKSLEFSSVLRHPVVFDASGMVLTFRELVLVEPGAEGSVYGFSDFYDYVILEASKDFGKNWFALTDGYDSRLISSWESAFNSNTDGQNSNYVGRESMMREHSIYPRISDKINSGDSLLIRFRLYSDPYSHGWGWVVDDLKINPIVDKVEEIKSTDVKLFPNPGNGLVNLVFDTGNGLKPVWVRVYNFTGKCIIQETSFTEEMITLDISGNAAGLYLIVINVDHGIRTFKYNLIK
jgi:hypothetical protein